MNQSEGSPAIARLVWQPLGLAALAVSMAACGAEVASDSTRVEEATMASAVRSEASDNGSGEAGERLALAPVDVEAIAVKSGGVTRNQVVVNGTPVASFSAHQNKRARVVAKRLEKLASDRKLAAHLAQPGLANGMAVGAIDDEVIFTVDEDTAQWYDEQPAELTVKWVNNLRLALGGEPLDASEIGQYRNTIPPQNIDVQGFSAWYGASFYSGDRSLSSEQTRPSSTYMSANSPDRESPVLVRTTDRGPHFGSRVLDVSTGSQSFDIVGSHFDRSVQ